MGRTYHFDCPQCQYRALISGGADEGIHCAVQTMVCRDCRELFDAPVRVRRRTDWLVVARPGGLRLVEPVPPVMLRDSGTGQLRYPPRPDRPAPELVWEQPKPACPVNARHRIEPWQNPGRCPRCGCFLERNGFPFRRWE